MGDMVHEQLANLFARVFHGELARSRHDVGSAADFLAAVGQDVANFPDNNLIASHDDRNGQRGTRQQARVVKNCR